MRLPAVTAAAFLAITTLCPLAARPAHAQVVPPTATIGVFLDCGFDCDQDFVRTEITYVDWVRDRTAADVHVLVTSQATGGGGREFTLAFLGLQRFAGIGDTLRFVTGQGSTADETRRRLAATLRVGLVRYLARTSLADRLAVSIAPLAAGTTAAPAAAAARDRWNYWVFTIGGNGNLNGEQSSSFHSISGNVTARRTTEQWKLNVEARQNYNKSQYEYEGFKSKFIRRSATVSQLAVRSLGPRLSAGVESALGSSTFENKRFFYRVTPAIEYDIFPYAESTRRMLTVQYAAGVEGFRYEEETIYFRTAETKPLHTLEIELNQNQPGARCASSSRGASTSTTPTRTSRPPPAARASGCSRA